MQTFNIDISQPRGPLVLYVSQGDSLSRFFEVTVTDNGAAYTPPDGAIYTVRFGALGMPAGWYDTITEVGGGTHPAVVVDENTYTVEIAEQAVSVPGTNAVVVIVSDATGYTLASWAFELQVAAVPGYDAPEATVYYNALTEQVAQVLTGATAAAASATLSESWAVGGTGTRPGEDTDNARYYAQQAQSISGGQLGWYATEQALQAAHPTGENGQWAIIGSTDTIWTWDSDTSAWVNSGSTADLSNYYTKAQADAAFATAAQGVLAASAVQSVNGKTGTAVTLDPQDVGGISTYTCTTSGTTHALAGTGNNIKFVADAAYATGDTITVNGTTVTAQTQDGSALDAGAWASGAVVACYLDGTTLNFKGGGGLSAADKAKLIPENIRKGVTIAGVIGSLNPAQYAFWGVGAWFESAPKTLLLPSTSELIDVVEANGKSANATFKKSATFKCTRAPQTLGGYCRIDGVDVALDGVYTVNEGSSFTWTSIAGGGPYICSFEYV